MRRPLLLTGLLAVIAVALVANLLVGGRRHTDHARLAASRSLTPAGAARAFALSYGRYLDGQIAASQLAYATPAAVADAGPQIRPAAQRRRAQLVSLAAPPRVGSPACCATAPTRSASRSPSAPRQPPRVIALASGVPEEIQASAPPPAAGEQAAQAAAAAFLRVYVPLLYGQARIAQLPDVTPGYRAELERTFHVPAGLKGLPAHLVGGIMMKAVGAGWQAWTSVNDSQEQYVIAVDLVSAGGRWLVEQRDPSVKENPMTLPQPLEIPKDIDVHRLAARRSAHPT